jgi:hypothetical protein
MGESGDYPLLTQEAMHKARSAIYFLYEFVIRDETDPYVLGLTYSKDIVGLYKLLRDFEFYASTDKPQWGKIKPSINLDGSLSVLFLERGPESHELESLLQLMR